MTNSPALTIAGFLVVDKPPDWTSADVVRKLKSAYNLRKRRIKIGHCGTLDPAATGVLPICIGPATRFVQFVTDARKTYTATVTFGIETDSYDADGDIIATTDPSDVTEKSVAEAVTHYLGDIQQVPPRFSAIKRDGVRMYTVARAGGEPDLPSRTVHVASIDIIDWSAPNATLEVTCGKGFYVRSLAHDLGQDLGCGAHLSSLRRNRVGAFTADAATQLDDLLALQTNDDWLDHLLPIDAPLQHVQSTTLDSQSAAAFRNGRPVPIPTNAEPGRIRIYDDTGRFLGLADTDPARGTAKPSIVLPH